MATIKAAKTKNFYSLNVSKIIFNPPATIVFWEDGTKTVVKCAAEDEFSEYYGFLAALGKKVYEKNGQIKKLIDKKAEWHENKKGEKDISDVIAFHKDGVFKAETFKVTDEDVQRLIRYILNGCDAEIKDLENQIGRM